MKQNWKRSAAALGLTLAMTLPMAGAVSTVPCLGVPPVPIGTVVDHVLYTDIQAYLDGMPIQSYCAGGKTVVAAEDLLNYGFDVKWNSETRALGIYLNTKGKEVTADYVPEVNTHPIGAIAGDVLATDIVVYVTDYWGRSYEIPSWNIGTQTVVDMNDLAVAFAREYSWSQEERALRMDSKRYTAWSYDISAQEMTDELKHGFAVKAVKGDDGALQVEYEGEAGAVEDLTVSSTGVSFSVYQRVTNDSAVTGLSVDVATFDPERDNIIQNKQENTDRRREELEKFFQVRIDGATKQGELWRGHGNGHTDYSFRFDNPTNLEDLNEIYIVVGEPLWVADHAIPHDWEQDAATGLAGTCERYTTEQAHIYDCSKPGLHGGNTALYVVWADGTTRELLSEMPELGMFAMNHGYYAQNVTVSEDGTSFTFECPAYELHDPDNDPYSSNYNLENKGIGTYRMDLVTRELTLESITAD